MIETKRRSILKALSWRFFATLITAVVAYAITGKMEAAMFVAGVDTVVKFAAYFLHERAWNKIDYGRVQPKHPDYEI